MAKTTVSNAAQEQKEFTLKEVFAMWKKKSKTGKDYFDGKLNGVQIRGFYNLAKKNPNEPDIRIYEVDKDGNLAKEEKLCLWCNATQTGKKYLNGKLDGKRVVGFINTSATEENKQPYFNVYWSEEQQQEEKETEQKNPF